MLEAEHNNRKNLKEGDQEDKGSHAMKKQVENESDSWISR